MLQSAGEWIVHCQRQAGWERRAGRGHHRRPLLCCTSSSSSSWVLDSSSLSRAGATAVRHSGGRGTGRCRALGGGSRWPRGMPPRAVSPSYVRTGDEDKGRGWYVGPTLFLPFGILAGTLCWQKCLTCLLRLCSVGHVANSSSSFSTLTLLKRLNGAFF